MNRLTSGTCLTTSCLFRRIRTASGFMFLGRSTSRFQSRFHSDKKSNMKGIGILNLRDSEIILGDFFPDYIVYCQGEC